jgi:hypothetical protein
MIRSAAGMVGVPVVPLVRGCSPRAMWMLPLALLLAGCTTRSWPAPVTSSSPASASPALEVTVDRRIEIMAVIFRLAGAAEFATAALPSYTAAIDSFFAPHREHPAVKLAAELRERHGIAHDAVMSLAVRLTSPPELAPRVPLATSELEGRWTVGDAESFARLAADFARVSDADRFFREQQETFDVAVDRMRQMISRHVDVGWPERFFGRGHPARFIVAVAPTNGRFAYSAHFAPPGHTPEIYAVVNVWQVDSSGLPLFSPANASTILHEFSHAFVNPVVDSRLLALGTAADSVLAAVSARMRQIGYTVPRTVISESLVRAATARGTLARAGVDSARQELEREKLRGFLWIDDLFALLGAYEQSRDTYATFADFYPLVASYFRDLAPRIGDVVARWEARRPRVVSMTPPNGTLDVDPATPAISFRFDRPMRPGYSLMLGEGGRERYPDTPRVEWDTTRTVLTMHVELRPDWRYDFWLNLQATGFMSEEGIPLAPFRVEIGTRASGS